MQISHVTAHNWRNFKNLDVAVADRLLIVGPNAAGIAGLKQDVVYRRYGNFFFRM